MMNVCITYHMKREHEIAETCITLPMEDNKAMELLATQNEWWQLMAGAALDVLLHKLSLLQGYMYDDFCMAEVAHE